MPFSNIIFAVPISSVQVGDKNLNKSLRTYAYKLKREQKGSIISNEGGFQSKDVNLKDRPIKKLLDTINTHLLKHVDLYELEGERNIKIVNLWFNINKPHDLNWPHCHLRGADFSAAYYIDVPKKSGDIVFRNPDIGSQLSWLYTLPKKQWNPFNSPFWFYSPVNTQLYIFPSSLEHHVKPNKSLKDRVSISFNFKVT
tara:strand:- start:5013 stop:5606 length:594 start_codon:yes stop_codon:yes gene_type:complete